MHTIEGAIYAALSECFKEPSEEFADDIASGRLEEVIKEGLSQLNITVPGEMLKSLRVIKVHGFTDETIMSNGSQRTMKIPLNPPFSKGENRFPPLEKGGKGGFERLFSSEIISVYKKLKSDYHSLFFPLYVVPVESVYKEWSKTDDVTGAMKGEKGFIRGDPAVEMINRYRMAGIEVPQMFKDTPDHIAILLEYASLLCENLGKEERACFVAGHFDWVAELCNDIHKYSESNFYRAVADITVAFIQYERSNLTAVNKVGSAHSTLIS